jgi:flagellar biosynthesis GTPase FlhF
MAPSPRKRAARTTTFDTTWNETDATSFDPNALPVGKVPRGWERKQEVKRGGEGKEKKIWRRFGLRSRADTTTQEEAEDEEEHDVRSRAVKRRQHVSPKAMEKTASKLNGKKRTFKATRWDRRKSVLPSTTFTTCDSGPH